MDYLRQIEEDLRNISAESKQKKKYPEVGDAADRALEAIKSIREVYVSEVMKKNKIAKLPQSSDILAPYLLVCNYADGNPKVTLMALNGMNLLLTYDLVPPSDVKNIMRVLTIQASSKAVDIQLKLLQLVLQLTNSLIQNPDGGQHLTEAVFCGFLTLAMQLCDNGGKSNNLSVSSTALGTVRQVIAQAMDGAQALFADQLGGGKSQDESLLEVTVDQASSKYSLTAIMLMREMCLFIQGLPGEWIRGVTLPQVHALDLLIEVLNHWKVLFQRVPFFRKLVQDSVFPALKPLLKGLQEEYVRCAQQLGIPAAVAYCSKVVKLARCVLLNFVVNACRSVASEGGVVGTAAVNLNAEGAFIVSMLAHALQPDRAGPPAGAVAGTTAEEGAAPGSQPHGASAAPAAEATFKSRWEEASSMLLQTGAGAGMFLSRLTNPSAQPAPAGTAVGRGGKLAAGGGGTGGSAVGFYLTLSGPGGVGGPYGPASAAAHLAGGNPASSGNGASQLPAFPALCSLEALLAFLLSDLTPLLSDMGQVVQQSPQGTPSKGSGGGAATSGDSRVTSGSKHGTGLHLFETTMVCAALAVCTLLQSALVNETNLRELESNAKIPSVLSKLLKGLLSGSFDHEGGSGIALAAAGHAPSDEVQVADSKQLKCIHEYVHGGTSTAATPGDLVTLAYHILQVIPRLSLSAAMQLSVAVGSLGSGPHRALRRSHSSGTSTTRKIYLSPIAASLVGPSTGTPTGTAPSGLVAVIRSDPSRGAAVGDALGRVCDSVYEVSLDTCTLVLNAATEASVVRASLGVISELAIVTGMLDMPRQCDIITSVLCKYTVPMWHAQDLYSDLAGDADTSPRSAGRRDASAIKWRHYQAFVRLSQVVHIIGDTVTDWDNIVDAFEQLVDYFVSYAPSNAAANNPTTPTSSAGIAEKEVFLPEVEKVFAAIERFKQYSVFLSDEALVRLMTSLVALSMNHLAVQANSVAGGGSGAAEGRDGPRKRAGSSSDIIQVSASPYSAAGAAGSAASGTGSTGGAATSTVLSRRIRPGSSSAGLQYVIDGVSNGTISFALQALIEVTKFNAFRISTVWQMVISHLRMAASLKSASSRAISVAATHDVILSSMRFIQQQQNRHLSGASTSPAVGLTFMRDALPPGGAAGGSADSVTSLVMSDELLFNYVLPSFETVFIGREIHRVVLEGRDDRLSQRPALSQSDLLSSLKALSSVRYSDVRAAIIEGLAQLLQNRGQIVAGGSGGGWPVILDLISSVPLSMAPATATNPSPTPMDAAQYVYSADSGSGTGSAGDESPTEQSSDPRNAGLLASEAASTLPSAAASVGDRSPAKAVAGGGSMASLHVNVIPQYQWPLESLVSAFTCMKLIVDEFLEVLMPDCELVSSVLHGLALFGSQEKDANISLTAVEMLWKVTDSAITYARSGQALRLSGSAVPSTHYVAVVFDIMLKKLFQLSNNGQPLIRHCAMNTLFSAMATHAPIISAEQWQQVFGNIIFPLFERAGARSRIAMWNKEEAIAPELKKGVKMSVHHSRDTAHKQWSETRVIALRGLSRVLRTCTRLLLQEAWFQVIWTDALVVCQGALQAACDEQEVSIAALDVVFAMLQIIIQADVSSPSAIGLASSESVTTAPSGSVKRRSTRADSNAAPVPAAPALSKEEVEHIERCKLTLWQLTWAAVRNTAFFPCNSAELALAIVQKLKELYKSRIDHEFRYSDNVRVLLEILVALVRPRAGLVRGSAAAACLPELGSSAAVSSYFAAPDLITQKQDRVAESQLQRAVMELLSTIQPTDGLAQSCLLSTLTEICFSTLWVQVPVSPQSVSLIRGEDGENFTASSTRDTDGTGPREHDWLLLGAAPEKLRREAAEHVASLLQLQLQLAQQTEAATDTGSPRGSKLFPWAAPSHGFLALIFDIVVRRFVADVCEGPLLARGARLAASPAVPASAATVTATRRQSKPSAEASERVEGVSSGFLASFGSIMSSFSSATSQTLQPVYPKHAASNPGSGGASPSSALSSARIAGGTLHKFAKYLSAGDGSSALPDCTPSALHLRGTTTQSPWSTFYIVDSDIRLLLTALQACHSLVSSGPPPDLKQKQPRMADTSPSEIVTDAVWSSVLTATACLLSPWQVSELCARDARGPSEGGASPVVRTGDPTAAASDIAAILRTSLQILGRMRYPATMTLQWVEVLVRSCSLGVCVVGSVAETAKPSGVGEFYLVLWRQVVSALDALLLTEPGADAAVRSRALWGAVEVTRAALRSLVCAAQDNAEGPPYGLEEICEEVLQLLLRARSTPAMVRALNEELAGTEESGATKEVERLLSRWLTSSALHTPDAATPKPRTSAEQSQRSAKASQSVIDAADHGTGHLVLVVPLCLDLALSSCATAKLKAVAAAVVKAVDLAQLTRSLVRLSEENDVLKARNAQLETEVATLRSANTLPF